LHRFRDITYTTFTGNSGIAGWTVTVRDEFAEVDTAGLDIDGLDNEGRFSQLS